jgi:hypothetical protein
MKPAVLHTNSFFSITFFDIGRPIVVMASDIRYQKCLSLFKNEDYSGLKDLLCPDKTFEKISDGDLIVDIENNEITYKGIVVHHILSHKILETIEQKLPYKYLINFLKNILECDSFVVLNELYLFLTSNESMPIMEDGSFLAYRVVRSDYMSKRVNPDGTRNRNLVGDIVTQSRNQVNPNRFQTCAEGLHFCSYEYIPEYGYTHDDRVMIVKVFPQDVITIPNDYNNSKGRCCKYEVIGEVENYVRGDNEFKLNAQKTINEIAYGKKETKVVQNDQRVLNIIRKHVSEYGTTTTRRVAKSTHPYVRADVVKKIAEENGYTVINNVIEELL